MGRATFSAALGGVLLSSFPRLIDPFLTGLLSWLGGLEGIPGEAQREEESTSHSRGMMMRRRGIVISGVWLFLGGLVTGVGGGMVPAYIIGQLGGVVLIYPPPIPSSSPPCLLSSLPSS